MTGRRLAPEKILQGAETQFKQTFISETRESEHGSGRKDTICTRQGVTPQEMPISATLSRRHNTLVSPFKRTHSSHHMHTHIRHVMILMYSSN
jgi:hypothetical protein